MSCRRRATRHRACRGGTLPPFGRPPRAALVRLLFFVGVIIGLFLQIPLGGAVPLPYGFMDIEIHRGSHCPGSHAVGSHRHRDQKEEVL